MREIWIAYHLWVAPTHFKYVYLATGCRLSMIPVVKGLIKQWNRIGFPLLFVTLHSVFHTSLLINIILDDPFKSSRNTITSVANVCLCFSFLHALYFCFMSYCIDHCFQTILNSDTKYFYLTHGFNDHVSSETV